MKYPQRREAEQGDAELRDGKEKNPPFWESRRKPAAHEATHSQSQHKRCHDHGHRLRIDAVNRKECPLPNHLINKRGHSRDKEEQAEKNQVFLPARISRRKQEYDEKNYIIASNPAMGPEDMVSPKWLQ